jgi:hypothetical protein
MKLNQTTLENIIRNVITKFNEISDNEKLVIVPNESKIIAICENDASLDSELALLYVNKKVINLDPGFEELDTRDKLIVIAACIKTHYQTLEGMVVGYGDILNYTLVKDDDYKNSILFNTSGKLVQESILDM